METGENLREKVPDWITPELVEDTIRTWQSHYTQLLSSQDAIGILLRVGGLFDVLRESDEQQAVSGVGPGVEP